MHIIAELYRYKMKHWISLYRIYTMGYYKDIRKCEFIDQQNCPNNLVLWPT